MTPAELLDAVRQALPPDFSATGFLKAGGQGSVFLGTYRGAAAALKLFRAGGELRLEREIQLLQVISCPNLVRILATAAIQVAADRLTLVAYEYHPNGDLEALLSTTSPPLAEAELARIGREVGTAVDALWAKRIVHRDVKPANIVRATDGRYVLVDVGVARHIDRSDLTGYGLAVGTPGYMSPEQASGRKSLTIRSDAFSLGLTLYELAAKRHPFGRDQRRILAGVPVPLLSTTRPDLSAPLCAGISQLLSQVPALRPSSLSNFFGQP